MWKILFNTGYHYKVQWVDQKVLKLLSYIFKYTTVLYETYTEY